jgi:pimeloyl-ACP methyl ester carboxylesterase
MRRGLIGFGLGLVGALLAFLVFQQIVIRTAADDFSYRFRKYVFYEPQFPWGYLDQGRVITRFLFPVKVTTTFYDAQYNVVTQAEKPGRYGAVVDIRLLGGVVEHRFLTLYRTPAMVFWSDGPMTVTAQFPPGTGIDPAVLQNQAQKIGEAVKLGFTGFNDDSPNLAIVLAGLSETSPNDPPAVARTNVFNRDADWWFGLRQRLGLAEKYPYLVDLPQGYGADPGKPWPLILYLHGGNEKGHNLQQVRVSGLARVIAKGRQVPAIVISPQCPYGEYWDKRVLSQLLDEICAKYRVDPDRIYLTGISMGGDAVWDMALVHPERFAALMTVAAEGDPADAARLKDIPDWAFHGQKDDVVPVQQTIDMVNGIRQAGGRAHMTLFPDLGHDAWDRAYAMDSLYTWLLAQKRGQPEVLTPGVPVP